MRIKSAGAGNISKGGRCRRPDTIERKKAAKRGDRGRKEPQLSLQNAGKEGPSITRPGGEKSKGGESLWTKKELRFGNFRGMVRVLNSLREV